MHEITSESMPSVDFKGVRCIKGYGEISKNYSPYLSDESKLAHQGAEYLFFPTNEAELSAVFQEMAKRGTTVTISAARTGIVGGAVPQGGAIVSLEKFDKILGLSSDFVFISNLRCMISSFSSSLTISPPLEDTMTLCPRFFNCLARLTT